MARSRVQSIRSNVSGARPASQEPGTIYTNFADRQIGVADTARQPMDMVAVRYFATTASYTPGQLVVQNGKVYRAVAVISPSAFDPTKWQEITVQSGSGVWVGDDPRAEAPVQGQLLWESDSGDLFVWYEDADGGQWVQINTTGDTAPALMVSPMAYGAAGDGIADDSAAVQMAMAYAYANGLEMYWEAGTYLTTSSIPHLHEVRHYGPGAIKRASNLFYPCVKIGQTNTLYVGPTGSDTNDGLSGNERFREIKTAAAALANYGPALNGKWEIRAEAGTYKGQIETPRNMSSRDFVWIIGASGGHPNVPTVVVDQAADPAMAYGLFAEGARVRVEGILFKDFNSTGSDRQGIYIRNYATLITRNVHCTNCDVGIEILNHSRHQIVGGIISNCERGVEEIFGNVSEFNGAGSAAAGVIIKTCVTGLKRKECSSGHIDWIQFEDNSVDFEIHSTCTANVGDASFKRTTGCAIVLVGNAEIHEQGSARFGIGVDAPALKFKKVGPAIMLDQLGWIGATGATIKTGFGRMGDIGHRFNSAIVHTGTGTATDIGHLLDILKPGSYTAEGANFRVRAWGTVGNAGGATLQPITVQLMAWNAMVELNIPAGQPNNTPFFMEWDVFCYQDGNFQRCFGRGTYGNTAIVPGVSATTIVLNDVPHAVALKVDLDNVADSLTLTDLVVEG